MTPEKLDAQVTKCRNLKKFAGQSDDQIREYLLQKESARPDSEVDVTSFFSDSREKDRAAELYTLYKRDYEIETISDKNMLVNLVYLEVMNSRFQDLLNKSHTDDAKTAPSSLIENLHANIQQISSLKDKLGLNRPKTQESAKDALSLIQRKYKIWLSKNQASRTLSCPHCGKMTMLRIRMDQWDAQKHPYFEDRLIYNTKLFAEYERFKATGEPTVIDEEFIASVLDVSPDYIADVIERRKGKFSTDKVSEAS